MNITSPFTGGKVIREVVHDTYTYKGEKLNVATQIYKCVDTGEEFTDKELDEKNMNLIHSAYRATVGIPSVYEIQEMRAKYDLSAAKMSEILGFGQNMYSRYENGEIPTRSNGTNLAMAASPVAFKLYIERCHSLADDEKEELLSKVENLISKQGVVSINNVIEALYDWEREGKYNGYMKLNYKKAQEIAIYFARLCKPFTTKLNKLLFYSDFKHYGEYGRSITGFNYLAIQKGPVPNKYSTLYDQTKGIIKNEVCFPNGVNGYEFEVENGREFNDKLFSKTELDIIYKVGERFKSYSTQEIVDFSHEEDGWIDNIDERSMISYEYGLKLNILD